jgi:hypothetical protein
MTSEQAQEVRVEPVTIEESAARSPSRPPARLVATASSNIVENTSAHCAGTTKPTSFVSAKDADVDLALDIAPFFAGAQPADELVESRRYRGRELEPG